MEKPPKFSLDMSLEERQKQFLEMPDEDIDYSDIPPLDEEFFKLNELDDQPIEQKQEQMYQIKLLP